MNSMENRKQRKARDRLFKRLPEVLGFAHALNDIVALDLHALMENAKRAGIGTFPELDRAMIKFIPAIIIAKDRAERQALADRVTAYRLAMELFGDRGSALASFLVPISKEMPPAEWHFRVLLDDCGRVNDANTAGDPERHAAAASISRKSEPPRSLH